MIYNADHMNNFSILYLPGIQDNLLDQVYMVIESRLTVVQGLNANTPTADLFNW